MQGMTGHFLLHRRDGHPYIQQACIKILCQEDVLEAENNLVPTWHATMLLCRL